MKVIYVAGPFRGPTQWDIAENIRAAERVGLIVAHAGAMPLIPHANTAHFHGHQTDQFWLDGTMELLRRCDGAVFLPDFKKSSGACGEYAECMRLRMPHIILSSVPFNLFELVIARFIEKMPNGEVYHSEEHRTAPPSTEDGAGNPTGDASSRHHPGS